MKKKVLLVSEYFYPHWTGISKAFFNLATQLVQTGHTVAVMTTQYKKSLAMQEDIGQIIIHRIPYAFSLSRTHYSPQTILAFWTSISDVDTVIINSPHSNVLPLSIMAKLRGKKLVIFHQGDLRLPRKTGNILMHYIIEKLFDLCTIPSMWLADSVSTYTLDYAKHSRVMKYFLKKCKPYIPPLTLSKESPSITFKNHLNTLKKDHILIGFAGRFVEEKGFDVLFEAIPDIIKHIPTARFVFAGQTNMSYEPFFEKNKNLIDQNRDRVEFLGLLDDANLAHFYSQLDVFVIPSRSDCFPLTQIEAALSNCPIVVADIPGARMLVKETGLGKITLPNNPAALAHSIISVIKNKNEYQNKSSAVNNYFKTYEAPPIN